MKQIIFLLFSIPFYAVSQDFNVSLIPDSLKTNADAVLRYDETILKILSPKEATYYNSYAITILNEEGLEYADYFNRYDKFNKITKVVAKLYDNNGKLLKTVKKKDMTDMIYNDRISIINDARTISFDFAWTSFPYTVQIEEEIEHKGIYFLPNWTPVTNSRFSVEKCTFKVIFPKDYKIHYKLLKQTSLPVISFEDDNTQYKWSIAQIPAFDKELFRPDIDDITPGVFLSPSDFEIDNYKGNMDSWQNLGNFILSLNKGRDILPENIKKEVHDLTDKLLTVDEKINVLYNYLQQNTRYISIQMGIGGYQPFEAGYVAKNKYGDCKALSNYMVSLLKEAGVNAKYVLIKAGKAEKGLWKDFPSPYFNHAIMCVPGALDTTWLECTSQYVSPGYMGSFTGNRDALMIDSNGGVVVHTPIYKTSDNIQSRNIKAEIDANGNLTADINTHYTGISQELILGLMHEANKDVKDKYLNYFLHLPTYHIESSDFKEYKGKIPVVDEHLRITAPNYANITSRRIFLQPDLINKAERIDTTKKRKFDICIHQSHTEIDSIEISIPSGYKVESVTKDVTITNQFGSYTLSTNFDNHTIRLYRKHIQNSGTFPASDYNTLASYYNEMLCWPNSL